MRLRAGTRALLLWLTLLPPLLLALAGWPLAGLGLLVLTHLCVVWGTLNPHSTLFGPVVRNFQTMRPEIWLTIDDGPSADTPALLDLLDHHQARATFFLVSERAEHRPDLVRAIVNRGHGIGNHSATHPAFSFWALMPGRMAQEISVAQQSLTSLAGAPPRWFRAVVGHANPFVAPALADHDLTRVSWSARGYDGVSGNVDEVVARLTRDLKPGAIILLHEGAAHGHNLAIARRVLEACTARGLKAVLPE